MYCPSPYLCFPPIFPWLYGFGPLLSVKDRTALGRVKQFPLSTFLSLFFGANHFSIKNALPYSTPLLTSQHTLFM
ncbi:hypothetical protein DAI22_03g141500 [Oryza sativa Japonica Group]|nr:hypothetical protein DAI22_03g141500 [Oryza sativa Japonica Group]